MEEEFRRKTSTGDEKRMKKSRKRLKMASWRTKDQMEEDRQQLTKNMVELERIDQPISSGIRVERYVDHVDHAC